MRRFALLSDIGVCETNQVTSGMEDIRHIADYERAHARRRVTGRA